MIDTIEHTRTFGRVARMFSSGLDRYFASQSGPSPERNIITTQADWNQFYLPHYFKHAPSGLHLWLNEQCDQARRTRSHRVNLLGPRGAAKSTIGSLAFPLRCAVEGWEPLIWFVSDTGDQAENILDNIKTELTDNLQLARDYPDAAGMGPVWRKGKIRLRNGVAIEAFGTGQKLRGRRSGANRPSLIICDDIQSDDVMTSALRRDKDWSWFTSSLLKAGNKSTTLFNLATALHRDAIGLRLDRAPGWTSRVFRAIEQWPADMGLWLRWAEIYHEIENPKRKANAAAFYEANRAAMHAGAAVLWPEEEDLLTLMEMRANEGHSAFEREKQNRPVNPEQCEWPEDYFDDRIWFDEWPRSFDVKTMALDPSKGKDARRSDYSAFVTLQVTDGVAYVDADLQRRPTPTIIQDGVAIYRAFEPHVFGVESNAFQELLGADFLDEFRRQGLMAAQPHPINNTVNKLVRIRTLGPYLSQRRLRFRRGSAGALLLVSQLKDFPDPHSHDDGPDALEMALRLASDMLAQQDEPVTYLSDE